MKRWYLDKLCYAGVLLLLLLFLRSLFVLFCFALKNQSRDDIEIYSDFYIVSPVPLYNYL